MIYKANELYVYWVDSYEKQMKNSIGKPYEGKLHVRFDAGSADSLHIIITFKGINWSKLSGSTLRLKSETMKREIIVLMLFISLAVNGQTFFIGHNETVSDSINRAWCHFEIVDSLVFPDKSGFVVSSEITPKNFVSETEKKYGRYSKRRPYTKKSFEKFYPDSSYLKYMKVFNKEIETYKIKASQEHEYNNNLDRLIFFQNTTVDTIKFPIQDGSLIALLEAKDNQNQWKPIEYWWYSWCGNSFSWIDLLPSQTLKIGFNSRTGNNKVFLRYKIHGNDTIYLSPKLEGYISSTQFVLTENVEQLMRKKYHGISFLDSIRYGMCEDDLGVEIDIIEQ